jgi:hypothetical protein
VKNSILRQLMLGISVTCAISATATPYQYPQMKDVSENNFSNTGFQQAEIPVRFSSKSQVKVGDNVMVYDRYINTYKEVNGELKRDRMIGRLDRLTVVGMAEDKGEKYIQVKINSSTDWGMNKKTRFVKLGNLSRYEDYKNFDADVYMVQNVATEKLRVYQRVCKDNSCPPRLILQTDFVAGFKKGDKKFGKRTQVGNYRIFEWHKFYQDRNGGHYPSWYDPKFPMQPDKDDSWSKWFKGEYMPWEYCSTKDGKRLCSHKGMMRGAFGWYTALVEPNYGQDQWTHGTIGWAESSEENIKRAKGEDFLGAIANTFTSLRSSGCSRVSNPTVAFLRHILPVGTPIIKIYALEKFQDEASMKKHYNKDATFTWDFALTKDGVRGINKNAISAHKQAVDASGVSSERILEEGTFKFKNYPLVTQQKNKSSKCREGDKDRLRSDYKKLRKGCNLYKIPAKAFVGSFNVDTGTLDGYAHPKAEGIIKGGFKSQKFPSFMNVKNYK